jgi:hypothetical protein
MHAWRANGLPESSRRDDILLAVAEHDNGWREVDDSLLVSPETGAVLDFMTVPPHVKRGVWGRAIHRLSATPYAAALVAQHAAHVYSRYRPEAEWASFFPEMETARDRYLRAARVTLDELLGDYLFLRIGDLISLVFCTQVLMQAPEFGYTLGWDGDRVTVTPDPFGGADVTMRVEGHELDGYTFGRAVTVTGIAT